MKSIRLKYRWLKYYSRCLHREIIKQKRKDPISITSTVAWKLPAREKFISNVRSILLSISEFKTRQAYPGGQRFREPEAH